MLILTFLMYYPHFEKKMYIYILDGFSINKIIKDPALSISEKFELSIL